jgi:hypothetical protein
MKKRWDAPSNQPSQPIPWLRRLVRISGILSLVSFLLIHSGYVGLLFIEGVAGTFFFLWPERFQKRVMSVHERRRIGIFLWLLVAIGVLVYR